jgi:hypothetical protein
MIIDELFESPQLCPECGGPAFTDLILAEKKDACYHKIKASAKVWPSAYASGRLVQCRKKGAANYGNKSEGVGEGYQFKGPFPFDVDHMHGGRGINLPNAETKKYFTDKKQWQRAVDDINSSKYDDNSDYIGVTGRSTVEINGREWARWSDAQQKGYIELSSMSEQGVAEAGFPGAPDVEMPPMKPSGDPQRDKLKQEYVDLHREIKSLVNLQYNSKSTEEKMQAKARIKQLNDRADQIRAILEPRQPPNEWQKKTYGFDDNWNKVNQGMAEGMLDNPGEPDSPVAQAIIRRILLQRTDLLAKHGPEKVGAAVDEVADFVGDVDEIGSSDVSGWVRHVEQMLGNMPEGVTEIRDRRDAYQRDYDHSVAGMGQRQSYAYRQDGGANDEDHSRDEEFAAQQAKKQQYERTGNFWLKKKDTQQHISDEFGGFHFRLRKSDNFFNKSFCNLLSNFFLRFMVMNRKDRFVFFYLITNFSHK